MDTDWWSRRTRREHWGDIEQWSPRDTVPLCGYSSVNCRPGSPTLTDLVGEERTKTGEGCVRAWVDQLTITVSLRRGGGRTDAFCTRCTVPPAAQEPFSISSTGLGCLGLRSFSGLERGQ
jgi:hypothetical protein